MFYQMKNELLTLCLLANEDSVEAPCSGRIFYIFKLLCCKTSCLGELPTQVKSLFLRR